MPEVYNMLYSLISLLLLWIMLFFLYSDYCVDSYRQKLFALRDELFDDGHSGKLPFHHKSYGLLRVTMNGGIRFAHKLNLGLLFVMLFSRSTPDENTLLGSKLNQAIQDLTDDQKTLVRSYHARLKQLTFIHMIRSSPIITATIILPIILNVILIVAVAELVQRLSEPLAKISNLLYAAGDDQPEALSA